LIPRAQRAFVIAMCATIGGAFAYAACDWGQWPRLAYLPLQRAFAMPAPAGTIAMMYWGIMLWGLGGAVVGALVGIVACAAWRRPWPDRALQLLGGWAITAIVLAGAYYTWNLWPW
jgi:hypothetical protein